ncbi:hypothetical protein M422DRAFT_46357 [Sphaerobolus stellatus SS14]|uniref:Unplaced genomic scaffold SPHSTscaffold_34, whole genome shotgun sequence n=1 Tax=Sphaerobolus stellatus (strain SS14) TaxID=990650 RepID=A0A0C9VGB6_SPHS4|nr:hypothetical protein M422DRAFT_46357 [Sphaerobolus stellatus SS14]
MGTREPHVRHKVVSCAECRRLKLKCNQLYLLGQFPCTTCVKRGLQAICPNGMILHHDMNGILTSSRLASHPAEVRSNNEYQPFVFIIASRVLMDEAKRLTQQNTQLTERMHLLEEALARHHPPPATNPTNASAETAVDVEPPNCKSSSDETNDSLGTLTIDKEGRSTFLGNTAGMEYIQACPIWAPRAGENAPYPSSSERPLLANPNITSILSLIPLLSIHSMLFSSLPPKPIHSIAQETLPTDISTVPISNFLHALGIFSTLHGAHDAVLSRTEVYLPPLNVAQRLIGVYYDKAAWLFNPIPFTTLQTLLSAIYPPSSSNPAGPGRIPASTTAASISSLFMIFAIGAFLEHTPGEETTSHSPQDSCSPGGGEDFDFNADIGGSTGSADGGRMGGAGGEESRIDAETYHQLGRTALSCDAVLVNPSLENIRALMLMAYYHILHDQNAAQHVWAMMGLVAHMAENIGLHRDPRQWKMPDEAVQERRTLFWEIYFLFMLQSISLGRPPPLALDYCDCRFPRFDTAGVNIPINSFASHKYAFASTILSQITQVTLGVNPISYGKILALDRRIRDHRVLKEGDFSGGMGSVGAMKAQMFMGRAIGEMALLYLHRRFFARALFKYPTDTLHCPFGPSVLAIFKAASAYITLMKEFCEEEVWLAIRFVIFLNNLLASSFIMAAIATRTPSSILAPAALVDLDTGLASRPSRALDIVSKIRTKAHKIISDFHAGIPPPSANPPKAYSRAKRPGEEDPPDAIDMLSGKTRLLTTRRRMNSVNVNVDANPFNVNPRKVNPSASTETLTSVLKKNDDLARAESIYSVYKQAHPELVKVLRDATATTTSTVEVPGSNAVNVILQVPIALHSMQSQSQPQPQISSGVPRLKQQGMRINTQFTAAQTQVWTPPLQATETFLGQDPQQGLPFFLEFSPFLQPRSEPFADSQSTSSTQPLPTPSGVNGDHNLMFGPLWDLPPPTASSKLFISADSDSSLHFDFMRNAGIVSGAGVERVMGQGVTAMDTDAVWDDFMQQFGMQVDSDGSPQSG